MNDYARMKTMELAETVQKKMVEFITEFGIHPDTVLLSKDIAPGLAMMHGLHVKRTDGSKIIQVGFFGHKEENADDDGLDDVARAYRAARGHKGFRWRR